MGGGRWDSRDWSASRASYSYAAKPTVDHIFTRRRIDKDLDPSLITVRESRDSAANPNSTPLIVGLGARFGLAVHDPILLRITWQERWDIFLNAHYHHWFGTMRGTKPRHVARVIDKVLAKYDVAKSREKIFS